MQISAKHSSSTNLPSMQGRTLAMAGNAGGSGDENHPVNEKNGTDNVAVVLPQHTHTGTHVHQHQVSQTTHLHGLPNNYPLRSSGNYHQSGGANSIVSDNVYNFIADKANITPTNPNDSNLAIQNTGTPNATMKVIQPTYYVENIFIYCC